MLKVITEPTEARLRAERRAFALKREGKSADEVIQILRDEGASIVHTILSLRAAFGMDAKEAKERTSSHVAWQSVAKHADAFHVELVERLKREAIETGGSVEVSDGVTNITM